jgi:PAS domain S-box-containing protein
LRAREGHVLWLRAIDGFVPEAVRCRGGDAVRRARLALGSAVLAALPLAWGAVALGSRGLPELGAAAAVAALLLAALPLAIRATGSPALIAHAVPLVLSAFCVGVSLATGGQATGVLVAAPVVPLAAVLLGGIRSGLLWGGFICLGLIGVRAGVGAELAAPWPADPLGALSGVRAAVLAAIGSFGVAAIYESLHARALRDLTDAHETANAAQRQRLESETRFRTLTENASDVIAEWDATGTVLYVSPQLRAQVGVDPEAVVGTHWLEHVGRVHPEDLSGIETMFSSVLEYERETDVALRFRHRDDSWHWLELTIRPFRNARGELRMVTVGRDVTERREVETLRLLTRELEETAAELARANRELEEFTSLASHDLQEPLRRLVSFSRLLRDDLGKDLPEDAARDLDFIDQGARRMHALVHDLLALSRAGVSEMKTERIAADACLDGALERLALRVAETGAAIARDPLPELRADPTLLTGIFQNLIDNALKFRGGAAPRIRITAERSGSRWTLGVRDNGIGVPEEHRAAIFEPFKRLQASGGGDGSGIGLAICRKAVERHGGRIWVESEPGHGAHFRFTLAPEGPGPHPVQRGE